MKYGFDDFLAGKIALRVPADKWDAFAAMADKAGVTWNTGESPIANGLWRRIVPGSVTVCLRDRRYGPVNRRRMTLGWREDHGYPIADWNDLTDNAPKPALKIIITTDGTTTTARMMNGKATVRSGVAKCKPGDTFDFETGAKLAFDRMMKRRLTVKVALDTSEVEKALKAVMGALAELPTKVPTC